MRNLYCLFDVVAKDTPLIFDQPNDACAIRSLTGILRHEDVSMLSTLQLWYLGTLDTDSPRITGEPRMVGILSDYRVEEK